MSDDVLVPEVVEDRIDLEKLKMLVEYGHTEDFIARFFDVPKSVWRKYKKEHPEFDLQLRQWKLTADERVERALFARAVGYAHPHEEVKVTKEGDVIRVPTIKHYPPDPTAAIFWLKNRKPLVWKEKVEVHHEGEVSATVTHKVDAVDIEDRIALLLGDSLTNALQ